MTRNELARAIYRISNIRGTFLLRSGQTSHEYFDKYLFEGNPRVLAAVAQAAASLLPPRTSCLAGLEMGGIPVATMISHYTELPCLFVRKTAKDYGTCQYAEGGPVSGRRLVIVEDVVTSGGAILDAVEKLRADGAIIEDVICVIDRESGGAERLLANGLKLIPVFTKTQLETAISNA